MTHRLLAGAAVVDISPRTPQFLYGYPHVPRQSTGIHDPLLSSSMYLCDGSTEALIIANDLIYVSKDLCSRVRARIAKSTGIPERHIMVTATHTHSGPIVLNLLIDSADPVVPTVDTAYLSLLEDAMVECALQARSVARPAEAGLSVACVKNAQTNRHNPAGPSDPEIPVLVVREAGNGPYIACMTVYSLHPTVLHEDSTLVSADFPWAVREHLQGTILGTDCPVLYHTGPAGNQSPRYTVSSNDFASAKKLGVEVGQVIQDAVSAIQYRKDLPVAWARIELDLEPRTLPSVEEASEGLEQAVEELAHLRNTGAAPEVVRTAECDWFGAEETLILARAQVAADGGLQSACRKCLPCEVQALQLGSWIFVAWQGEIFVEYALQVKERHDDVFIISLANGELGGYIVTEEAVRLRWYESCNAIFDHRNGSRIVKATEQLVAQLRSSGAGPALKPGRGVAAERAALQ